MGFKVGPPPTRPTFTAVPQQSVLWLPLSGTAFRPLVGHCADASVLSMCDELVALAALESLSLASNHLSSRCAPALAMIVREAYQLVLLDVSSNLLKAAGVRCVVQASFRKPYRGLRLLVSFHSRRCCRSCYYFCLCLPRVCVQALTHRLIERDELGLGKKHARLNVLVVDCAVGTISTYTETPQPLMHRACAPPTLHRVLRGLAGASPRGSSSLRRRRWRWSSTSPLRTAG
jgi:hypothetical protein